MLGLNNIQIIGNLGGTPDMKFLNDGKSQVVNFSVAVNERWKNRDGDEKTSLAPSILSALSRTHSMSFAVMPPP